MSVHASSPAQAKKGRQGPLFVGVVFFVSPTLMHDVQANISSLLTANGATKTNDAQEATHIISDTDTFEGWRQANKDAEVVTPLWVERSLALDTQQNPKGFSSDPRMIFSGIVASSVELPEGDKETMRSSITALGGQWREMLTRDVTHFFCLTAKSEKYHKAMSYLAQSQMRVLLPHWFDDSFNARRLVPYDVYSFPNPPLFDSSAGLDALTQAGRGGNESAPSKELLFKTALLASDGPLENQEYSSLDVWQGRRVYLAQSLDLHGGRRAAVETMLQQGGAHVVELGPQDEHELQAVAACDVLVTRFRDGAAFEKALRTEKIIGTLAWVLHVQHRGKYSSPLDQLLHFPLPRWTIKDMAAQKISITNYSGAARDYLRKLVDVMGGEFTSTLSSSNTLVVAASLSGKKTSKARDWAIPVVNHLWLEDCFIHWKLLTTANEKYIRFPYHGDMNVNVGECGLGRYTYDDWKAAKKQHVVKDRPSARGDVTMQREDDEEEIGDSRLDVTLPYRRPPSSRGSDLLPPPATNTSMRDESEVDGAVLVDWDVPLVPEDRRSSPDVARADDIPATSSPLRRLDSKATRSSGSKRRLDRTDDEDPSQFDVPAKRFKGQAQQPPLASTSRSTKRPVAEDVIELDFSEDELSKVAPAPVTPTPSSPVPRRGQKRGRDADIARARSSSLTPPPSSVKRPRPEAESQAAAAHDALSPLTNVARRRPKAADAVSEHSFKEDAEDDHDDSQRRRSGRAAAAKATKTLKEVVMPDVLKFETKERRGKRNLDTELRIAPAAKNYSTQKTRAGELRATKSKSVETEDDDEPVLVDGHARTKRETQATQAVTRTVFYIATMVTITDEEQKALATLGARPTTKAEQCTHLIAEHVVRTEKFLTAINYAPYIVSKDWVVACIEADSLVSESGYLLRHAVSELKYNMKLSDAVRRAKDYKGTLLKGCTFYVTDNAVADHDLLKAVVKAAGGEVKKKVPNLRQVQHDNTYLVSHGKDSAIWRPLARQGITVYNSDFILNSVLRQQLLLKDASCRLPNSE